ncbi:alpha-L-fucosidase [Bacteroides sp.]|uniref:alpha-L-fucosidase n=1 Tax=Bacteroides sp. TaxID=29523 RepID=UPI0025BCC929|nr:alpha-L-fucosidase [Bacteroides sp.]
MKSYYKSIAFACCLAVSSSHSTVWAQSGDEQGLEVPARTQLPQDKEAITKANNGWWKEARKDYDKRMAWYNDAKFGCFIHWGVYSVPAGIWKGKKLGGYTEHLMRKGRIPLEQYKKELVAPFNPTGFDADEWMRHASEAGMRYFIITAKHHDGFAMYPSDAYPYDIRMTRYDKDPMEALRKAAGKYGIKFGFYYSHAFDWEHPDAPGNDWDYDNPGGDKLLGSAIWWKGERQDFLRKAEKYVEEKSIPQIQELIRKYDPDILWFDTPSKIPLYLNIRILEAIREADPQHKIVVNGRLARFGSQNMGDYRNTGDRAAFFFPTQGVWESIPTTNESYGYSVVDTVRKSVPFFVRLVASAASKGGNILMNVGPMGNGKWDKKDIEVFQGIGKWLTVNGESIYGTQRTNLPIQSWGVTTLKGDTLYAHVHRWPVDGKIIIGGLRSEIKKGWFLADKKASVKFKRLNEDDYELSVPVTAPDTINPVVALVLNKQQLPNPIRLLDARQENILYTFDAELQGRGLGYGDGKPNRNYVKNWKSETQSMKWKFRLNEPAEYTLYLDYNTAGQNDTGTVTIEIAGQEFKVDYPSFYERKGSHSIRIGKVNLPEGASECSLKGKRRQGEQYMNPIAIRLEK